MPGVPADRKLVSAESCSLRYSAFLVMYAGAGRRSSNHRARLKLQPRGPFLISADLFACGSWRPWGKSIGSGRRHSAAGG